MTIAMETFERVLSPAVRRRRRGAAIAALLLCGVLAFASCAPRSALPHSLSDRDYWSLVESVSEPAGSFTLSDNIVSNEPRFAEAIKWLSPAGGVYIGVGPEQNFSYIAALRPDLAFIVDIRRENLDLHLLYKALFELSTDRADFVSRLFSRPRPAGLDATASVDALFDAFERVPPTSADYDRNIASIRQRLLTTRGLPLPQADLDQIDLTFRIFFTAGPQVDYYGSSAVDAVRPSYRQLMTSRDFAGASQSFLADEERFQFVKSLHTRNLILPVVGDFGGPKTFRAIGAYVRERGALVRSVYASNVGVYLSAQQALAFCHNLAALPAPSASWFLEMNRMRTIGEKLRSCSASQR
jgi:hypothetical protein